jgi:hypothetical protein
MSNKNIESNLKKLLKGERACIPEHFLKVPAYNSPTLRIGKGKPLSEGQFGKMYRGSINDNGRRYVAYKEIDTSGSTNGAFEFEFKVAEKLKEFAVPEMYLFKKCPLPFTPANFRSPKKVRNKNGTLVQLKERTKPKDILYMELLNGMSFNSWWQTKPSLDAMKSVIVQVFDNLYRINQKFPDFRHRDLHGGNVMVTRNETPYTWKVDLGRKVIRNDPGGSFRSRLGSPDIKKYKLTNAGVEATIIDFGLSYWSRGMPNPETADGGYWEAGIYGHGQGPGTIYYDIHRFLYIIYVKVRQPENAKERAIKNFIEELIPNKEFLEYNGKFTSQGYLVTRLSYLAKQNLPSFKTILTHPFLTWSAMKVKTPPKIKTPKKAMNNMIKKAAAILAANKAKTPPKLETRVLPPRNYGKLSTTSRKKAIKKANIESGRKKAGGFSSSYRRQLKATKGKTPAPPTPVRLKEKFSFTDIKGKKREYVRKGMYEKALAKNKAERSLRAKIREARGGKAKTVTPKVKTPTPKKAVNMYINKFVNKLDKDEVNALKKKICKP